MHDLTRLPANLPEPVDDGAADHLRGMAIPADLTLPSTDGGPRALTPRSGFDRLVVFAYPRTGRPDEAPLVDDWDLIPGARGCTPQACAFRDLSADFAARGADVLGVSTQDTAYQREAVDRLHLPFPLLSDAELRLTSALRLPTMTVAGSVLLRRLGLVIRAGVIERFTYPVFPPDRHADQILAGL